MQQVSELLRKTKVLCVVDYVRKRGRYCYWKDRLIKKADIEYKELSISEMRDKAREGIRRAVPRFKDFQVVILNYDVANGGYEYDSDVSMTYFALKGAREIKIFINAGGRLVCEIQATGGIPIQASYDAIFGSGELRVMDVGSAEELCFRSVVLNPKRRGHPILRGLEPTLESKYKNRNEEVFPNLEYGKISQFAKHPDMICWGWFTQWKKGWIPLLLTPQSSPKGTQYPVMLAKKADNGWGEYIATTMRIANSEIDDLINNLVTINQEELSQFYKTTLRQIKFQRILLCFLISFIAFGFIIGLGWLSLFGSNYPEVSLLRDIIDLVFGPAFVGMAAAVYKLCRWIWERPYFH